MADNPKSDTSSSVEASGLEDKSGAQKISLLDHVNGFHYNALKKSENFVIDMDTFSHGDTHANPRITKSLSRKGPQRGGGGGSGGGGAEKKSTSSANDRDATFVATSSPKGTRTSEKQVVAAAGSTDHPSNPQVHQITIMTGNIITTPDGKAGFRRNNFKRTSHSWAIDPKRVLLFFATLSSMGTILLIYLTLSMKHRADENILDYKS